MSLSCSKIDPNSNLSTTLNPNYGQLGDSNFINSEFGIGEKSILKKLVLLLSILRHLVLLS